MEIRGVRHPSDPAPPRSAVSDVMAGIEVLVSMGPSTTDPPARPHSRPLAAARGTAGDATGIKQ